MWCNLNCLQSRYYGLYTHCFCDVFRYHLSIISESCRSCVNFNALWDIVQTIWIYAYKIVHSKYRCNWFFFAFFCDFSAIVRSHPCLLCMLSPSQNSRCKKTRDRFCKHLNNARNQQRHWSDVGTHDLNRTANNGYDYRYCGDSDNQSRLTTKTRMKKTVKKADLNVVDMYGPVTSLNFIQNSQMNVVQANQTIRKTMKGKAHGANFSLLLNYNKSRWKFLEPLRDESFAHRIGHTLHYNLLEYETLNSKCKMNVLHVQCEHFC